jgi:hypothetical protein
LRLLRLLRRWRGRRVVLRPRALLRPRAVVDEVLHGCLLHGRQVSRDRVGLGVMGSLRRVIPFVRVTLLLSPACIFHATVIKSPCFGRVTAIRLVTRRS